MMTYEEAIGFLRKFEVKNKGKAIFRGEPQQYPNSFPSVFRLPSKYQMSMNMVLPNLASHIYDAKIKKHLTNSCGFTLYKGAQFGANDLIDPVDGLEPRHTSWALTALLQHYGLPTPWLDYTRDPSVSMLFASQNPDFKIGYIYYGTYANLFGTGVLIDLSKFVKELRAIFPLPESRPERQSGLAFRPRFNRCGRAGLKVLQFQKDPSQTKRIEQLFPNDAMRAWAMGQVVDYYIDYLERKGRFYADMNIDEKHNDDSLKKALEQVITELDLWQ